MIRNHTFFRKELVYLIALLLILPILSSCAVGHSPDTSAVLSEMLKSAKDLPAGSIYTTKSSPGAPDHLSEGLLASLYGTDGSPDVFSRTKSISLWLSSGLYACELGVFLCANRSDAEEIADLCLGRIDTMRHFINSNSDKLSLDTASSENIKNARVTVHGRYVIMAVASNPDAIISAASELIS